MKLTILKSYTILAFIILIAGACKKEYESIEQLDENNIQAYIKKNSLSLQKYNNGDLYYQILKPGTGAAVAYNQQMPILYTIRSLDGKFSSLDTFTNRYADYVGYLTPEGLRIGVKEILQKSGGSIRLIIPSRLAFGRNGQGTIPGNASLELFASVLDKATLATYDDGTIKNYMQTNNLTGFTKTSSGVYYKIADVGTGTIIDSESTVEFAYTGKLFNGTVFESSEGNDFALADLIDAWKETIPMIKEGGSIRLLVPSDKGYGFKGSGTIPPFSCLDFDIKAKKVIL